MRYHTLQFATEKSIAQLRLARPEQGNPIDAAFLRELEDACARINDDPEARVAVLTAEGAVFSQGWAAGELGPAADVTRLDVPPPFTALESMGQPVICALNGDAIGAGLELALACDVRLAAEGAVFALPEVQEGRLPRGGGTQRLARLVGRGEALRLLLLAERIDAAEAWRIGLVSAVVPRERLVEESEALARRLADRGPLALRFAKEAVRRGLELSLDQALRLETDLTALLQTTEDRAEGVRAFLEKRAPTFRGR